MAPSWVIEELRALPAVSIPSWPARWPFGPGARVGCFVRRTLRHRSPVGSNRLPHLAPAPVAPAPASRALIPLAACSPFPNRNGDSAAIVAARQGDGKTERWGDVSPVRLQTRALDGTLMPCVTSFAGPPVLPSMRYSRLRRWSVVYASVYELHARVSDGGGGPSYDR